MATKVPDKGLLKFRRWALGINNMSSEPDMSRDDNGNITTLHDAVNVDLDRNGSVSRRDGYVKLKSGVASSLWVPPDWPFGFVLYQGAICAIAEDGSTQPLVAGFAPWDEITFADLDPARVAWSNGARAGQIDLDLNLSPLGVAVPDPPMLSASASGGLAAGSYQVTTTWQRAGGEESGAAEAQVIDVPEGGGIMLSDIPQPDDVTIERLNVYVTPWNGDTFYRSASVPIGVLTYIVGINTSGKRLDTMFLEPVPAANIYRRFNARLLYANGNVLGWSEAVGPTVTNASKNRHGFGSPITMLEPITQDAAAGVWVAAGSRTWFLEGQDPSATGNEWHMRIKHPYGAVPGSARIVPANAFNPQANGHVAFWLDSAGFFCTGSAGGVLTRLTEKRFTAGALDRAASFFRERNGARHVITTARGGMADRFAIRDSLSIKVIRNGQEI